MTQIASIVYNPAVSRDLKMITCGLIWTKPHWWLATASKATAKGGHHPDRQLNLMSYETLTILRGRGFYTEPGQMGEQIVIHQMDVDSLAEVTACNWAWTR